MGERSLLLHALHEHRDRRPNALINENNENFFLVAKKNRATAARRSHATDLHFDNGLIHTASLVTCVYDRTTSYRIQSALLTRCSTDLSRRGTAVFLEGLTPSKTAGMSWRPSMPGTTRRLTSSTRSASRKAPLMWPPPSRSSVRIPKCSPSWFTASVRSIEDFPEICRRFPSPGAWPSSPLGLVHSPHR